MIRQLVFSVLELFDMNFLNNPEQAGQTLHAGSCTVIRVCVCVCVIYLDHFK